jgi:hypothetical protein
MFLYQEDSNQEGIHIGELPIKYGLIKWKKNGSDVGGL